MKRNTLDLLFPIIGVVFILRTFQTGATTVNFFGTDLNVWIYRGFWVIMIVVGLYRYFNPKQAQK